MKFKHAIKQSKELPAYQSVGINILFTASRLGLLQTNVLRPLGISWQQFNVLRILRGQQPSSISVKEVGERMIDYSSNTSRLIDRLVKKGYVERMICPHDRRMAEVSINDSGLQIVNDASRLVENTLYEAMKPLTGDELKQLNELLDKIQIHN